MCVPCGGDFDPEKWTDDQPKPHDVLNNFTGSQLLGVEDWLKFYRKGGDDNKYFKVGVLYQVDDGYFDADGRPTQKQRDLEAAIVAAVDAKAKNDALRKQYPSCNSQFKAGAGGQVWCPDETKVPRKGKMPWDDSSRCACYTPEFAAEHKATLEVYLGCKPDQNKCKID